MKNFLILILLVLFTASCQTQQTSKQNEPEVKHNEVPPISSVAVVVTMEGSTHELHNLNWSKSFVHFSQGEINAYLMEDDNPVEMNLRLTDMGILKNGAVVYELPANNKDGIVIDLNFFNRSRESLVVQQRILFTEGTIDIKEITRHSLKLAFKGSGHPLMSKQRIPMEGTANISF